MSAAVAPYGSWRSPVSAELVAKACVWLYEPLAEPDGVYWVELRTPGGRSTTKVVHVAP